jgi:peptidoglycan/xylan/chitin deacetylase (PgdA/CDA1 family)
MHSGIQNLARKAFHSLGALHLVRGYHRSALRVLLYHRFTSPERDLQEQITRQCEHLRRHYTPVSEDRVLEWFAGGPPLPPNAVLVSVDDGHQDFYSMGWPVFASFNIPALVFLVSDFIDGKIWLWFDKVRYAFRRTSMPRAQVEFAPGDTLDLALDNAVARENSRVKFAGRLKALPESGRLHWAEEIARVLEVDLPSDPPPEYRAMTWDQVAATAAQGASFGAHTRTHPILSRLSAAACEYDEIDGSKRRIEERLGFPVRSFAYPNGHSGDFTAATVGAVRRAGFALSFTAESALIPHPCDPFQIPRVAVDAALPDLYFRQLLAGFRVQ